MEDRPAYPPISAYAIIGDSRANALVSLDGSVDWLCLPDFDSPSLFGRLLDWRRGGHFRIAPAVPYKASRRYLGETNILETTFRTAEGVVTLTDFMPALTEVQKRRALQPLRALLRIVEGCAGCVPMRLEYAPRPVYGTGGLQLRQQTSHQVTALRGRHATHLMCEVPVRTASDRTTAAFEVSAGRRLRFALTYAQGEPAVLISDRYVDETLEQSLAFWRDWAGRIRYDGPYRDEVVRSALTLKLLSYAPSGAIIAAATTSLPEVIGGERNWDYRFCWIRDAAFTAKAFLAIGLEPEADAFVSWLMHATHETAPRLDPLYTLHGNARVPERELSHFEGYWGSRPVRVGNAASAQAQFDVYGELVDAFHRWARVAGGRIANDEASFIRGIAGHVTRHWREPDNGIWEQRLPPQHYTQSKVMAWDALTHAAAMVEEGRMHGDAQRWRREARAVRELVLREGYSHELRSFTQTLGGDRLDASLLMLPLVGFVPANDPRMLATIDRIGERLTRDGFVQRYDAPDGLTGGEGAFVVCNFWLAAALARAGRTAEARATFERTLVAQNDVGLMAEEYDPRTGIALGNVPQALSHIGLVTAATEIARAEGVAIPHEDALHRDEAV